MPIIINELTVDIQRPEASTPIADYGINPEENLQKLLMDLEIAEERRKRLQLDWRHYFTGRGQTFNQG